MSRGFTPDTGPSTVELILPAREHACQLPLAKIYPARTLARCAICGDVWLNRVYDGYWKQWWRLGWFGLWRHRKALR